MLTTCDDIIRQKLKVDKDQAVRDLQTSEMNPTTVAYQLVLDNRPEFLEVGAHADNMDMTSMALAYGTSVPYGSSVPAFGTSFPDAMSFNGMNIPNNKNTMSMASSAPGVGMPSRNEEPPSFSYKNVRVTDEMMHIPEDETSSGLQRGGSGSDLEGMDQRKKRRPKWHMGVRTKKSPRETMDEIYRAVLGLGGLVKVVSTYQVRCQIPLDHISNKTGHAIKMALSVYRYDDRRCLVSMKRIEGDMLSFFDVCAVLLKTMKI